MVAPKGSSEQIDTFLAGHSQPTNAFSKKSGNVRMLTSSLRRIMHRSGSQLPISYKTLAARSKSLRRPFTRGRTLR
eukprot:5168266-Prorocentrum_lima.AAC.1